MKKISKLLYSAMIVAALGMVSCSNDKNESSVEPEEGTLYTFSGSLSKPGNLQATTQKNESRMALDPDNSKFKWAAGDVLRIYNEAGSHLKSYTVQASDIQSNGNVLFSVRLSGTPKFISFSSQGDFDYVSVNSSNIKGYTGNNLANIPILAQGEISSTGSFSLKHKLAYIHYRLEAANHINGLDVTALGNDKVQIGDITNTNSNIVLAGTSAECRDSIQNEITDLETKTMETYSVAIPQQKYEVTAYMNGGDTCGVLNKDKYNYDYVNVKGGAIYTEAFYLWIGSGVAPKKDNVNTYYK